MTTKATLPDRMNAFVLLRYGNKVVHHFHTDWALPTVDADDVLARGGRYTCSGAIAGPMVEIDLRTLYLRDLTFTGSTVIAPHNFTDLAGHIERDEVRPLLAATYPLAELKQAQQAFIDKRQVCNIVVTP